MSDPEYLDWRDQALTSLAGQNIPAPEEHTLEHAWDDGVEPDELAAALPRYQRHGTKRQIAASVQDVIAQTRRPEDE